jgi:hypothetical protein
LGILLLIILEEWMSPTEMTTLLVEKSLWHILNPHVVNAWSMAKPGHLFIVLHRMTVSPFSLTRSC